MTAAPRSVREAVDRLTAMGVRPADARMLIAQLEALGILMFHVKQASGRAGEGASMRDMEAAIAEAKPVTGSDRSPPEAPQPLGSGTAWPRWWWPFG